MADEARTVPFAISTVEGFFAVLGSELRITLKRSQWYTLRHQGTNNMRWLAGTVILIAATLRLAAQNSDAVIHAASTLDEQAAKAPVALSVEFRVKAAQALQDSFPDLARGLVQRSIGQLRSGRNWRITPAVMQTLATLAPSDVVAVLPLMAPDYASFVIDGLVEVNQIDAARAVYRSSLVRGGRVTAAIGLLIQLVDRKSPLAADVCRDMLSGFSFNALEPDDAWWILTSLTTLVRDVAPAAAADGAARVIDAVAAPVYGDRGSAGIHGQFQVGSRAVTTQNSRDTLLLMAGAQLHALAPEQFENRRALFSKWDLTGSFAVTSIDGFGYSPNAKTVITTPRTPQDVIPMFDRLAQLQGAADGDRATLIPGLSREIRALRPSGSKLNLAVDFWHAATRGDSGKEALSAVASTLGQAIHDSQPTEDPSVVATSFGDDYLKLAELIRYENVPAPFNDPALRTADALLALRERLLEHTGFSLIGLDGKTYSLSSLRGRVLLVGFFTVQCPRYLTCDVPVPGFERLQQELAAKGLAVFGISSDERESLDGFVREGKLTYPILLDPDGKAVVLFDEKGPIDQSFVFDRQGKLVARGLNTRTELQLREMLRKAGVE
jgi:peroxiredoxin